VIGRLAYVLRETWASFRRNVTLTVAAIITSAVALLIFGLTLYVQKGFDNTVALWEGGVEMIVQVNAETTDDQRTIIEQTLGDNAALVEDYQFCDVQCALDEADVLFAADPTVRAQLTEDNIPRSYKVVPRDGTNIEDMRSLDETLRGVPNVRSVVYPGDWVEVVSKVKGFVGLFTLILSILLLLAAILLIWNTIRTAMFARRREIEVMKLVGATDWFIRIPFMLEGLIQGLVGALCATGALWLINNRWTAGVEDFPPDSGLAAMVVDGDFQATRMLVILIIGMAAGAIGSGIAASRFLDV
jgi:cell division transport system permease protein